MAPGDLRGRGLRRNSHQHSRNLQFPGMTLAHLPRQLTARWKVSCDCCCSRHNLPTRGRLARHLNAGLGDESGSPHKCRFPPTCSPRLACARACDDLHREKAGIKPYVPRPQPVPRSRRVCSAKMSFDMTLPATDMFARPVSVCIPIRLRCCVG